MAACSAALDALDAREMKRLIQRARITPTDRRIAQRALIDRMRYADIGAEVGYTEAAVGYRLRKIILPQLNRLAGG